MKKCIQLWGTGLISLLVSLPLAAHEFWISPTTYVIPPEGQVQAHLRVGQNLSGPSYSFQPRLFERFDVVTESDIRPVEGRIGDVPALDMDGLPQGLAVIVHETGDNRLRYATWEKFLKFVKSKDLAGVPEAHVARGIRDKDFTELYRRFAKSLVAIGHGEGSDQEVGLRTEIIALANPYTDSITEMEVKILLDGAPRADAQIEVFDKLPSGDVITSFHRTDANGLGRFPVKPGHEYLVDAVAMEALDNDDADEGAVWISLWAALTFSVPEAPL